METVTLKPIEIFFCNVNSEMNLTGHCHYAEVIVQFENIGDIGFPSFKETYEELMNFVQSRKLKGIKGTNEYVLRYLFDQIKMFDFSRTKKYKGKFKLRSVTLKVMGVQDENNHSNGFTVYKKTAK